MAARRLSLTYIVIFGTGSLETITQTRFLGLSSSKYGI
jgi:hypothetical protein